MTEQTQPSPSPAHAFGLGEQVVTYADFRRGVVAEIGSQGDRFRVRFEGRLEWVEPDALVSVESWPLVAGFTERGRYSA